MSTKILIVEDELDIREGISEYLSEVGYDVMVAEDGQEGIDLFKSNEFDLVLLDIMLPKINGFGVLSQIREISDVPVMMLTAMTDDYSQIMSFNEKADDYITKPFSLIVLISKVNAFMRRIGNTIIENIIFCDKLKFDYVENKLTKDKEEILLSKNEGKLLKYLMENSSQTVTKEKLMEALWDIDGNFVDENTVAVNIRRLRQKVEDNPSEPEYIKNIRGVGYTFAKRCIKK